VVPPPRLPTSHVDVVKMVAEVVDFVDVVKMVAEVVDFVDVVKMLAEVVDCGAGCCYYGDYGDYGDYCGGDAAAAF